MSNDPKDAAVDVSKLLIKQDSIQNPFLSIQNGTTISPIDSCNGSNSLIGHENFTHKEGYKKQNSD